MNARLSYPHSIQKQANQVKFELLPFWQQQILSAIESLKYAAGLDGDEWNRFNRKAVQSLRPYIPYLVHETLVSGVFLVVNRDYRPLGLDWGGMVDYDRYIHLHLNIREIVGVRPHYRQYQGSAHGVDGNFFMDGSAPWRSKLDAKNLISRLEQLMSDTNPGVEIV